MHRTARTAARTAAALTTAGLLLVPLAGAASAHVTVQGPGATQGGFTKLTFRAPTEKDVPTTKLEIAFPTDTPIPSVRVKPKTGWTYEMTKAAPSVPVEAHGEPVTEVVTRIIWTAAPGNPGIGGTEFDEFEVSAGPLPEIDQLVFKALQTYADGDVVRWIEEPVGGGEEPEKPAPVLKLAAASAEVAEPSPAPSASPVSAQSPSEAAAGGGESNGLSIAALVLAALALAAGVAAVFRPRRSA